jgi:hypothetical protein
LSYRRNGHVLHFNFFFIPLPVCYVCQPRITHRPHPFSPIDSCKDIVEAASRRWLVVVNVFMAESDTVAFCYRRNVASTHINAMLTKNNIVFFLSFHLLSDVLKPVGPSAIRKFHYGAVWSNWNKEG